MAPPSWMTPPSGQPISTQFAMKKVDLAVITDAAPHAGLLAPSSPPTTSSLPPAVPAPSMSVPSPPLSSPPLALPACWRCQTILEAGDKFCRTCGARVDAAGNQPTAAVSTLGTVGAVGLAASAANAASAATQIISQLSLPTAPPIHQPSSSSTMVLPAMKLAQSTAPSSSSHPPGPTATMVFGAVTVERTAKLILVRGHNQFGSQWRLQAGETIIGRSSGMVLFPDDTALAPRHARLVWRGADLMLEPELTTNGVYIRLRGPTRLQPGDEFLVGAQRLRVLADTDRPATVRAVDDTRLLGSTVKPIAPIALLKVAADDVNNEVYFRPQRLLTIGRAHCDITFPVDGFVSERHAQLTNEGSHLTLEDLGSRNGTYVRTRTAVVLAHGDLLLLGDQVLRIELPQR
jgi:pSer/pThr/pTyr-binding forkhead associated (FHA) protein